MPRVKEETVEAVVVDVSKRMEEATYGQLAIGSFAQQHPDVGRFLGAHLEELGGGEGVMHTVFHAQVLNECFHRATGRALPALTFVDLDHASTEDEEAAFTQRQPHLASYVASNVEDGTQRRLLALIGLAMSDVS
jgi:hypothetical protein